MENEADPASPKLFSRQYIGADKKSSRPYDLRAFFLPADQLSKLDFVVCQRRAIKKQAATQAEIHFSPRNLETLNYVQKLYRYDVYFVPSPRLPPAPAKHNGGCPTLAFGALLQPRLESSIIFLIHRERALWR